MLPILEALKTGDIFEDELIQRLAAYFELTDDEAGDDLFNDRLSEAVLHLRWADLIKTEADRVTITPLGKQVLQKRLNTIVTQYLKRLPGYEANVLRNSGSSNVD